ncbi:MAG TPA: ATP-binding protein, partial [Candidatus Dormibacteraeota bacterium]|nr:ATP-binding protein [Candidatus Dormibacteraeota bacterium]
MRSSFASRLLVGALSILFAVVLGISAFLLVSRDRATRDIALGNAQNRAAVSRELIESITEQTGISNVQRIAGRPELAYQISQTPATVRTYFSGNYASTGHNIVVLDARGTVLFDDQQSGLPEPNAESPAVVKAMTSATPVSGVEALATPAGSKVLYVASAQRVTFGARAVVVGVVVDLATLDDQLIALGPVITGANGAGVQDFTPVVVGSAAPGQIARVDVEERGNAAGSSPATVTSGLSGGSDSFSDTYDAPLIAGGAGQVAGAFVKLVDASGATSAYVGVEVPVSIFAGDTRTDEISLGLISLFLMLFVAILVFLFVQRFVRRPVERLERGVARIAGGDYATDIPVASDDELGRLAGSVNRMRAQIATNVAEIEDQRAVLDRAVERLGGVSRALTTTSEGIPVLQRAVVRAATSLMGRQAAAVVYAREDRAFEPVAMSGITGAPALAEWGVVDELIAGRGIRVDNVPPGWRSGGLLAVPMVYQGEVKGALALFTAPGAKPRDSDLPTLAILANNAAVALENTRLFEQERQTVQRLRELDAMKSDFLATVQHELRTPLTAIMGMSDLLEMCWPVWDDKEKLEAVNDIQMASKNLYEIVETIIDFSLLERDTLGLRPAPTPVRAAVEDALDDIASRRKAGLEVRVDVQVDPQHEVWADPDRFGQVVRALLDNAVKFSPPGSRVVVHSTVREGMVRLDVVDQGVGIPEDAIDRIFDRFFQVDNSATRQFGGTGMGLALVRRLVEAHGARVEVDSAPGRGSR